MYTREALPLQWAMTQNNLGNALQSLGDQGGTRPCGSRFLVTSENIELQTSPLKLPSARSDDAVHPLPVSF